MGQTSNSYARIGSVVPGASESARTGKTKLATRMHDLRLFLGRDLRTISLHFPPRATVDELDRSAAGGFPGRYNRSSRTSFWAPTKDQALTPSPGSSRQRRSPWWSQTNNLDNARMRVRCPYHDHASCVRRDISILVVARHCHSLCFVLVHLQSCV